MYESEGGGEFIIMEYYRNKHRCCDDYGGPDFSKMDFKKLEVFLPPYIDWWDSDLWLSVLAILILPLLQLIPVIKDVSISPLNRKMLETVVFISGLFKLYKLQQTVSSQPSWPAVQDSWALCAGYGVLSLGIFLLFVCLYFHGFRYTFIVMEPQASSRDGRRALPSAGSRYMCSGVSLVATVASVCVLLGYSLLCASQTGVLLSALQGVTYYYHWKWI